MLVGYQVFSILEIDKLEGEKKMPEGKVGSYKKTGYSKGVGEVKRGKKNKKKKK